MKVLITGICGFAGSTLALRLREVKSGLEIFGVDNFIRAGSELNRRKLAEVGIRVVHADVRISEDLAELPKANWVIDAAAQPSVLAGTTGSGTNSRQLMQHNLEGTINVLEYCRRHRAGFTLLSTSRVYSIPPLAGLKLVVRENAFFPASDQPWPVGVSQSGVAEKFSITPPVSLYGASKVCSEVLALEYGLTFDFPVWINRLGVLAGAGQFGRADQGIFSFWIHSCAARRPLKFIGFGGEGFQVRDCLHPRDLGEVLLQQMEIAPAADGAITNFSGGSENSMSLRQLHDWCEERYGTQAVQEETVDRPFDLPWVVLDSSLAEKRFGWKPTTPLPTILDEIAWHAKQNPAWLDHTA
ncbi:MAG: NAD-dependent epimerase/dehydratase family protein [Verrucomicrobiota bacterium]